ncbi:MAG TPA: hypothetical protein DEG71_05750 [Clostridiales bacterium]|nr:hypothetical protein [Clostridiales bacterium]
MTENNDINELKNVGIELYNKAMAMKKELEKETDSQLANKIIVGYKVIYDNKDKEEIDSILTSLSILGIILKERLDNKRD